MDYIIPDNIKEELFHGSFASLIDGQLSVVDFSSIPGLKGLSSDEISNRFKAYVYLAYMQNKTLVAKALFMRLMCSLEPDIKLIPMIKTFIELNEDSSYTDEQIKNCVTHIADFYGDILKHALTPKYMELSEKYDQHYMKEVMSCLENKTIKIEPHLLLTLTKCIIINGMDKSYIITVDDAVNSAYVLFFQRHMTFDIRKKVTEQAKDVVEQIDKILEVNGFTRS